MHNIKLKQDLELLSRQVDSKDTFFPTFNWKINQTIGRIVENSIQQAELVDLKNCLTLCGKVSKIHQREEEGFYKWFDFLGIIGWLFPKIDTVSLKELPIGDEFCLQLVEDLEFVKTLGEEEKNHLLSNAIAHLEQNRREEVHHKLFANMWELIKELNDSAIGKRCFAITPISMKVCFSEEDILKYWSDLPEEKKVLVKEAMAESAQSPTKNLDTPRLLLNLILRAENPLRQELEDIYVDAIDLTSFESLPKELYWRSKERFARRAIPFLEGGGQNSTGSLHLLVWNIIKNIGLIESETERLLRTYMNTLPSPLALAIPISSDEWASFWFSFSDDRMKEFFIEFAKLSQSGVLNFDTPRLLNLILKIENPLRQELEDIYVDAIDLTSFEYLPKEFSDGSKERFARRAVAFLEEGGQNSTGSLHLLVSKLVFQINNRDKAGQIWMDLFLAVPITLKVSLVRVSIWCPIVSSLPKDVYEQFVREFIRQMQDSDLSESDPLSCWCLCLDLSRNNHPLLELFVDSVPVACLVRCDWLLHIKKFLSQERGEDLINYEIEERKKHGVVDEPALESRGQCKFICEIIQTIPEPKQTEFKRRLGPLFSFEEMLELSPEDIAIFIPRKRQEAFVEFCLKESFQYYRPPGPDLLLSVIYRVEDADKKELFLQRYLKRSVGHRLDAPPVEGFLDLSDDFKSVFFKFLLDSNDGKSWGKCFCWRLINSIKDLNVREELEKKYIAYIDPQSLALYIHDNFNQGRSSGLSNEDKIVFLQLVIAKIKSHSHKGLECNQALACIRKLDAVHQEELLKLYREAMLTSELLRLSEKDLKHVFGSYDQDKKVFIENVLADEHFERWFFTKPYTVWCLIQTIQEPFQADLIKLYRDRCIELNVLDFFKYPIEDLEKMFGIDEEIKERCIRANVKGLPGRGWQLIRNMSGQKQEELRSFYVREMEPSLIISELSLEDILHFFEMERQLESIDSIMHSNHNSDREVLRKCWLLIESITDESQRKKYETKFFDYVRVESVFEVLGRDLLRLSTDDKEKLIRKVSLFFQQSNYVSSSSTYFLPWELIDSLENQGLQKELSGIYNTSIKERIFSESIVELFDQLSPKHRELLIRNVLEVFKLSEEKSTNTCCSRVWNLINRMEEPQKEQLKRVFADSVDPLLFLASSLDDLWRGVALPFADLIEAMKSWPLRKPWKDIGSDLVTTFSKINRVREISERELLQETFERYIPSEYILECNCHVLSKRGSEFIKMREQVLVDFTRRITEELSSKASSAINSKKDRQYALNLAVGILECQKKLGIEDDSELIRNAIGTILFLEGDKQNKYYVYAKTKYIKLEHTNTSGAIGVVNVKLTPRISAALKLRFEGLQEGLSRIKSKRKTYREFTAWIKKVNESLPEGSPVLGPDIYKNLIHDFLTHIQQERAKNSSSERLEKLEEVVKKIKSVFSDSASFAVQRMQEPMGSPEAMVDRSTERLYAIASILLQKKNIPDEGELLSEREDLIRTWLSLIEECIVGQERGIAVCYNKFKVFGDLAGPTHHLGVQLEVENSQEYLDDEVQKVMEELLPEVLREFGITTNQGVHQVQTLKNILGEEAGLDYPMTMDPYGGVVDRKLLSQKREDLLRVFFYLLTKSLVDQVKIVTTLGVNEKESKLYENLTVFFEAANINPERAWHIKEAPMMVRFSKDRKEPITMQIALECLRSLHFQEALWEEKDACIVLTEKGKNLFEGSLHSQEVNEKNVSIFLALVESHNIELKRKELRKSGFEEEVKKSLIEQEVDGGIVLNQTAYNQFCGMFSVPDQDRNISRTVSELDFRKFFADKLSKINGSRELIKLIVDQGIKRWKASLPWSLEEGPSSYELTEYGAVAFLQAGGYIEVYGKYKEYLDRKGDLSLERHLENAGEVEDFSLPKPSIVDQLLEENIPFDIQQLKFHYKRLARELENCRVVKKDCETNLTKRLSWQDEESYRSKASELSKEISRLQKEVDSSVETYRKFCEEYSR